MRRAIDPVDTIWLNMDRPDNLMVIESLMTCAGPVDWDRFADVMQTRVVDRYPVFAQRPVPSRVPLGMPHWEDVPDFDVTAHLRRFTLPPPGDDAALMDHVNGYVSTPLLRDRPLWEMHLIDGYRGGSALYSRLHHALADGIALMRVLLSMTDADPDVPSPDDDLLGESRHDGPLGSAVHLVGSAVGAAGGALLDLPHLLSPSFAEDALTLARQTTGIAAKLTLTRNPASAVNGTPGVSKRAVWAPPIPLADVAAAGHRTGTTVNDVLVAALAGALSTYLRDHDGAVTDLPTMVPVNVRPLDEPLPRELGNRFALVLLTLPSGLETPFARLAETKRRMDAIKHSPEAYLTFGMIRGIGRTGKELERYLVDFFADKATGVTTNVPGPRGPRYLAGTRIDSMLGWAPESGNQTLGTCIFTYDGHVHVGFKVDSGTIEHPEELLDAFGAEIESLLRLAQAG
ncbi:wax ester/triacylglycerol synthase family O-acyltransferase [Nocardioides sp. MAHUQ-72]|uniref:wax ester/triacylglycerol synthase family O-acyltransferase n=1 Tax=unclassified Nocardioides TaxID=2615069 RepID=UPI00360EE328